VASRLEEETQRFRRALLAKDREASARLTVAYARAVREIDAELAGVRKAIQSAKDAGVPDTDIRSLLFREGRLQALDAKVRVQVQTFARGADVIIGGSIDTAREIGRQGAATLVDIALPEGISVSPAGSTAQVQPVLAQTVNVPTGAVERAVPAAALLDGLAPAAADAVGNAIAAGIAQGKNPRVIARSVKDALGGNLTRALTISRTETLRAYREATREVYLANADVVQGQQWVAALDTRTCPACIALHGSVIPLGEAMPAHPNCRCTVAPLVAGGPVIDSGASWFRAQAPSVQSEILGPSKFAAFRSRQITLPDLVQVRTSPVWGRSSGVASLSQAQANAAARRVS
jgi:SPP1 gp7 family putative phage head morphogenesis protein